MTKQTGGVTNHTSAVSRLVGRCLDFERVAVRMRSSMREFPGVTMSTGNFMTQFMPIDARTSPPCFKSGRRREWAEGKRGAAGRKRGNDSRWSDVTT